MVSKKVCAINHCKNDLSGQQRLSFHSFPKDVHMLVSVYYKNHNTLELLLFIILQITVLKNGLSLQTIQE